IFSFVGTGTSLLAFAAGAAKRSLTTKARGAMSIYYLGGLTEGTETMLAFVAFCLTPASFPVEAFVFGALCWITTASRIATAVGTFSLSGSCVFGGGYREMLRAAAGSPRPMEEG